MTGEKSNHKNSDDQAIKAKNSDFDALFLDRVKKIAAGRTLTPWLTSLGWISNDVTRIRKGFVPGSAKLLQLAQAENVNLNWLLTGVGQRHVTEHWLSDSSIARRVDEVLRQSRNARVLDVRCSRTGRRALVIEAPQPDIDVPCFVILCGPVGALSDAAVDRHPRRVGQYLVAAVPAEVAVALYEGRMLRTELIDPAAGICLAEAISRQPEIRHPDPVSLRDQLHARIEQLSEQQVRHLVGLLSQPG